MRYDELEELFACKPVEVAVTALNKTVWLGRTRRARSKGTKDCLDTGWGDFKYGATLIKITKRPPTAVVP